MTSLRFSVVSVGSMLNECFKGNKNVETGGVLVGPNRFWSTVSDIIPSSEFAERGAATYFQSEKDVKILNEKLKVYQESGYDFKGYFHRHPAGMTQLSSGDLRTCKTILESSNYKIKNRLIMLIVTCAYGGHA